MCVHRGHRQLCGDFLDRCTHREPPPPRTSYPARIRASARRHRCCAAPRAQIHHLVTRPVPGLRLDRKCRPERAPVHYSAVHAHSVTEQVILTYIKYILILTTAQNMLQHIKHRNQLCRFITIEFAHTAGWFGRPFRQRVKLNKCFSPIRRSARPYHLAVQAYKYQLRYLATRGLEQIANRKREQ